jgi:hypothetical protein
MVLHSCVFAVLLAGMRHVRVVTRQTDRKYAVRLMNVREAVASLKWSPPKSVAHQAQTAARRAASSSGKAGISAPVQEMRVSQNFETPKPAPQTLIQPEVPPDQRVLPELPIPQATVWTPEEITRKKIVPPTPQPPGAIQVRPSLAKPNHELNPAEVSLSSIPLLTEAPMPVPGTTSPVRIEGPTPAKQLRQTVSPDTEQPSAARVLALSKNKLETGTAALPVVNEIAQADTVGTPVLAEVGSVSEGNNKEGTGRNGTSSGHGAGAANGNGDGVTVHDGLDGGPGTGYSVAIGGAEHADAGTGVQHIKLPKNGQYSMVVVGASDSEDYPETADLWSGRLVYTVYLQTDTSQNWILQYSLLHSLGDNGGALVRPDAPWPYDMMRPNLGSNRDDVLVHGFVNAAGRFEQLSIAYPPVFGKAEMLLRELNRWEFRPAMSQGQPATVEVLLIIPAALD